MAKTNPEQSKLDPYKEIVIIHDTKTGSIKVVGGIDEKTFKHNEVDAISANNKAFMEVKKTSVVKNFISNLISQAKEPQRFGFYIVPEREMPGLVDNLYKLQADPKDGDARKAVQPYRTSGRQLDRIKFDKYEIPFEQISNVTGQPRSEIEKNIRPVMEGKPYPDLMAVNHKLPDGTTICGDQAFRMQRDAGGVAGGEFYALKPIPEFEEAKWAQEFTQEEKNRMAAQKPLDRLIAFEKDNGREYCFAVFNPLTNHIEPVSPKDISLEEWAFRSKLSDTQMQELSRGHKVFIEKGKVGPDAAEFSGKAQYDPYQERYVASDMSFQKPYINQHLKDQLTKDDYIKMMAYEAIDGRKYESRNGQKYNSDIRISKQTNMPEWGNFLGQNQNQTQGQAQAKETPAESKAQGQDMAGQWPDNDTHQGQAQSAGQRM